MMRSAMTRTMATSQVTRWVTGPFYRRSGSVGDPAPFALAAGAARVAE